MRSDKDFTDILEEAIDIGAEDVTEAEEGFVKVITLNPPFSLTPGVCWTRGRDLDGECI